MIQLNTMTTAYNFKFSNSAFVTQCDQQTSGHHDSFHVVPDAVQQQMQWQPVDLHHWSSSAQCRW